MRKVYSYIRMSNPEQARGDSLQRQTAAAKAWADRLGMTLDETLTDIGKSGYTGEARKSGALGEFLALVDAGKVERGSVLVVENLDRLSREPVVTALRMFLNLLEKGIQIVTVQDDQHYTDENVSSGFPVGLLCSIVHMYRAHDESVRKGIRLSSAWTAKRKLAHSEKKPMTHRCPAWIELSSDGYKLIEERAEIVRRIFNLTANGIGRHAIVRVLNEDGVPAFVGKQGWHHSYIQKLLESKAVIGEYQPHRLVDGKRTTRNADGSDIPPIQDDYPAAISESLYWQALEARRARRGQPGQRGDGVTSLLSGLCHCGLCGAAMSIVNKSDGHRKLMCSARRRGMSCENDFSWKIADAERLVIRRLRNADLSVLCPEIEAPDTSTPCLTCTRAPNARRLSAEFTI